MPLGIFSKSRGRKKIRAREFDTFKDKWWENSHSEVDVSVLEELLNVEAETQSKSEIAERELEKHYQSQRTRSIQRHDEKEPLARQYPCHNT